jgi:hypothetical protein
VIPLPNCPVCDEIDGCGHLLLEWYGSPTERMRGSLWSLVDRMMDSVERLMVECCRATVPPRYAELRPAFDEGMGVIESIRDHAAKECAGDDEWERVYWGAEIDWNELRTELSGHVTDFVIGRVHSAPQVTKVIVEERPCRGLGTSEYVSLWAADPLAVRRSLLDLLAPLEVQLDQFYFERGETPPRGLIGK